uniref:NADH-ubiquinone oxidoreductase chain 2 n=1 Tax=Parafronurus youi TaxID=490128 RepID=B6CNL1_9INSE|nr:NADH dehydrogenase subunit 2 [Parafronurus youi]ABY53349.1 NADH dehydrogenase subunit 2 [Parafronurus youi]
MLLHPTRLLFYLTLMTGTMISISSSSWLGAWIGLEINLLSFIPLMSNKNNQFSTEAALKYFLTQALASAILIFGAICLGFNSQLPFSATQNFFLLNSLIAATLLLKMGAAPFHFWFPGVMEGLSWLNGLILMTWQKIAPLMLISYVFSPSLMNFTFIILCALAGSLGGFNQTSLRKIMAYSSINHLGWMLAATLLGNPYWITYFLFYSFLSSSIVLLFNLFNISHIAQIFSIPLASPILKLALFCNLLSLGGLPPFLGFLPKWIIIQGMVSAGYYFIITIMVTLTLITLYFYIRMGYSAFMIAHHETKWLLTPTLSVSSQILVIFSFSFSFLGLLLCSMIISIV